MMTDNNHVRDCAIEIQGLTKSYGTQTVLRGINLKISLGETLVILGPNGAGKTTLIKILATIMKPSSGQVRINGLSLSKNTEELQHKIGVVTHQTYLYSNLTVYENLEFYCRMYDVPRRKDRINEIVNTVGMSSRLHDKIRTLSRGMQQRVSIARSLLHKPSIMLLDEPETGLDQEAITLLWKELQTDSERKLAVVFVTHNLERGLEQGNRLLILNKGNIVFDTLCSELDLSNLKSTYQQSTGVQA
jgi:heme exporter protein A